MARTTMPIAQPRIVRLDWECNHFGLCVHQLVDHELDDDALTASLQLSRQQGVQLLVWPAEGGREVPRELLAAFGGALVDRKATFCRPLPAVPHDEALCAVADFPIRPYTATTASAALVELAIAAGVYSRFRVDPRLPHDKFAAMYRIWVDRSGGRELADVVLIASQGDHRDGADTPLGGMITLSERGGVASIGLIAVAADARGKGIGSALMQSALDWMQSRGAREAQVVTQLANSPACRLYERSGFQLSRVQHYFHFWL